MTRSLATVLSLMVLGTFTTAATAQRALSAMSQSTCELGWSSPVGGVPGMNGAVSAMIVFDDGSGPALYVGGSFTMVNDVPANFIARWDGESWSPVGGGMNDSVHALAIFDDGTGPALYAGGDFTSAGGVAASRVARWDGQSWSPLGQGVSGPNSAVLALTVVDDGTGDALYVGGSFTMAGGEPASRIAKWDGKAWSPLGEGVSSFVYALSVFDDGNGDALYVGGAFTTAGDGPASRIARWDGQSWSPLGSGVGGGAGFLTVRALGVFDDGSGERLYVGGSFTTAGDIEANRIAVWDGDSWSALDQGADAAIRTLAVFNDGNGDAVYVGGVFSTIGGVKANRVARWDGNEWSALGGDLNYAVSALATFDDGKGERLYIGGSFLQADGEPAYRIAVLDGVEWRAIGSDNGHGPAVHILSMTTFDSGSGHELYVNGNGLGMIGGVDVTWLARWNGETWSSFNGQNAPWGGSGEMRVLDMKDGNGPALYLGGAFIESEDGDITFNRVARWDGTDWSPLGEGIGPGQVNTLELFDDGDGPSLYAGGSFTTTGDGTAANRIARWNGTDWMPLGSGLNNWAWAMAVFDDGSGPALYVGGSFTTAGGVSAPRIARWTGSDWEPVGEGFDQRVFDLTVFDDGTGPALYAAGAFTASGSTPMNGVARWDGKNWSPVGEGMNGSVWALYVDEIEVQPVLYAGGEFTSAGGMPANSVARWDGTTWSTIGSGVHGGNPTYFGGWSPGIRGFARFDDGNGSALYVNGNFDIAGCTPAAHLARLSCDGEQGAIGDLNFDCTVDGSDLLLLLSAWGECPEGATCPADLNGDGIVDGADLLILLANWG